jgi:hypothetical protein
MRWVTLEATESPLPEDIQPYTPVNAGLYYPI